MISGKIAFVILTWNSGSYISACLDSLLLLPAQDMTIFIADNGSTDDTCGRLFSCQQKEPSRIRVTYLPQNMGTTVPRNLLLKSVPSDTKWICVLDSDTVVNASAIEVLIDALCKTPGAMLASPRMWKPGNIEQLSCKHFPTLQGKLLKGIPVPFLQAIGCRCENYDFFPDSNTDGNPPVSADKTIYSVDYAISACWMLKAQALNKPGLLDEHYFYAPEDVDYCAMIWENGGKVLFASGASIYHNTQQLSHRKIFSSINRAHVYGLFYYFRKHHYLFKSKIRK